jgi:uncharacterized membrane protein YphA (DoxX/SURF4 family)
MPGTMTAEPAPHPVEEPQATAAPEPPAWSLARRVAFRFGFALVVILNAPFPLGPLPGTQWAGDGVAAAWRAIVPAMGRAVLGIQRPILTEGTGSGDRTFDWIQVFMAVVLAVAVAALWSAIDRRRRAYDRLHEALRVYVRYVLAFAMLGYGFAKITKGQFPPISPVRLLESYGQSSPMALLWNFMGFSGPYQIFSGAVEVLGGALLLFRRTTTLGALVVALVMTNVAMLNFCFDVPVKLYSSTLLAMAAWLAARDARPLVDFFLRRRPAALTERALPLASPRQRWAHRALKTATVVGLCWGIVRIFGLRDAPPATPFDGFWNVESFAENGQLLTPCFEHPARWRHVSISAWGQLYILRGDGEVERFRFHPEPDGKAVVVAPRDGAAKMRLASTRPDAERWVLNGTFGGRAIEVQLRRTMPPRSFLLERGFHWINEFPLNR